MDTEKLRLMIIVGTRPEIIKLSAVIKNAETFFETILVHTGQNYDYELNKVFSKSWRFVSRITIWAL